MFTILYIACSHLVISFSGKFEKCKMLHLLLKVLPYFDSIQIVHVL